MGGGYEGRREVDVLSLFVGQAGQHRQLLPHHCNRPQGAPPPFGQTVRTTPHPRPSSGPRRTALSTPFSSMTSVSPLGSALEEGEVPRDPD